jgi:hypothetical protein
MPFRSSFYEKSPLGPLVFWLLYLYFVSHGVHPETAKGGRTLKHIGAKMGLSAEAVRQIEKRALKCLRQEIAKLGECERRFYLEAM